MRYIGIDVASSKNTQVVAMLDDKFNVENLLYRTITHKEEAKSFSKDMYKTYGRDLVVAIDGPRRWAKGPKFGRDCEREIRKKLKVNIFLTPPENKKREIHEWMQVAMWFFEAFGNSNSNVIEVFPSASYSKLKGSKTYIKLRMGLVDKRFRKDVLDAITAALTGYYYHKARFQELGNREEGFIVVPRA